jgi:DNA-binding beta-propeller fold protein YncE
VARVEGGAEVSCPDGTKIMLKDGETGAPGTPGAPGAPGQSCTIVANGEGAAQIRCPDGTTAEVETRRPPAPAGELVAELLAGVTSVGSADGVGTQTRMDGALDGAFSPDGEFLYFVDTFNMTIRRFGLRTQRVTTLAGTPGRKGASDGVGAAASFEGPRGIAMHPDGKRIFIADGFNCTIRQLELPTMLVTTLAGQSGQCAAADGAFEDARFRLTIGLAMDPGGRYLYLSDRGNHSIRRMDLMTRQVETIAGLLPVGAPSSSSGSADGQGSAARFNGPGGIALSADGTRLFVNDTFNSTIRSVQLGAPATVTTIAGQPGQSGNVDGVGAAARFSISQGLTWAADGLYVAGFHGTIRRVDPDTGAVVTVAGVAGESGSADGPAFDARFGVAFGVRAHPDGRRIYYMDRGNNSIRLFDRLAQTVTTVMGAPEPKGWRDGDRARARMNGPAGVAVSADGQRVYVLDRDNHLVRLYDVQRGLLSTLVGLPGRAGFVDGALDQARLRSPEGLWLDESGGVLYIADTGNDALRKLELSTGMLSTVVGRPLAQGESWVDGPLMQARLDTPVGVVGGRVNGQLVLYVSDAGSDRIRMVSPSAVSTLAGGGTAPTPDQIDGVGEQAVFDAPAGLALSADGATLYVADQGHEVIRAVTVATGATVTLAGDVGEADAFDGVGPDATFNSPGQLALHADGRRLLIVDEANHAIRQLDLMTREVTTVVGELGVSGGTGLDFTPLNALRLYFPAGVAITGDSVYLSADAALMRVERLLATP